MSVTDSVCGPLLFAQQRHEQISHVAGEADQIKLALYDRIKNVHVRSPGSHAFSQYVSSLDRIVGSAGFRGPVAVAPGGAQFARRPVMGQLGW
jgi:hypothetical protein